MRLFVSVDLPASMAPAVEAVQDELRDASGLRFTDPAQAHVTLSFLGDTAAERVPEVEAALEDAVREAGVGPFEATVGGLGVFPSLDYVSVVWLGFESGGDALGALHDAVEAAMVDLGFEAEERAFVPHVTVARMDHAGGTDLVTRVVEEQSPTVGTTTVEAVRLKESVRTASGSAYTTVASVPLPA